MVGKIARDLAHGDLCRLIEREAVDARADGREIDRMTVVFARKAQAVAVAVGQQLRLAVQESPEFVDAWFELARLLEAGDLPSACRRLMVCACEDVGLAYPQIIPIVKAAVDAANMLGLPEARIPLADAVILVATSPKSNTGEAAIDRALADVRAGRSGPIPRQLQNKHYDGADAAVKGQHYQYAHDFANHWVDQQYLPDAIRDRQYYQFGDNKNEQAAAAYWQRIKGDKFKK